MQDSLILNFKPQELDYIAQVLSKQPWLEVNALLVNIQRQIQEQQYASTTTGLPAGTGYVGNGSRDPAAARNDASASGSGG